MTQFRAILGKDLRLEIRSGESTIALIALSLLILVVIVFALSQAGARGTEAGAGALWIAMLFSGMLGAVRALSSERDNGTIYALLVSPVDRTTIYFAKLTAAVVFMAIAEVAAVVLMVLFFNLNFDFGLLRMLPILALGVIGFGALATVLSAVSGHTRMGDLILPVLAVPLYVPALIAGVKASAAMLSGAPFTSAAIWIKILIAFDLLFVGAGYLLFEFVIAEN
ncbi:MAG: heme exporter protein CcmB [Candidatus Binataceae bacterium]|nr:heme exporter protein CcmB [Candidatus Binataceae bacterium]